MKARKRKKLILILIKNDLINNKLITSLNHLGVDASTYYTYLSTSIFELMGFEAKGYDETLYDQYNVWSQEVTSLDHTNEGKALDDLAEKIYGKLKQLL